MLKSLVNMDKHRDLVLAGNRRYVIAADGNAWTLDLLIDDELRDGAGLRTAAGAVAR